MNNRRKQLNSRTAQAGAALLEALIAILIFSIGILAAVGMQAAAIKNVTDSKYRTQASFLANRLIAQMWTDAINVNAYAYPGSGPVPAKIQTWVSDVNNMPNATALPPIVSVANATAQGGTVTVQVRWQLAEEKTKNLPPHNYTAVAAIYGN
jgi:type IV pilus assembly protein PilV